MAKKTLDFEQAMTRLEEIVGLLERGEAPLEQSLALFEEGTVLMRQCSAVLDEAEQKVSLLKVGSQGQPEQMPFDGEE
ncbi:MAG: exodeoxyribonuclease VII small subunit [Oscillospiraceae bacterium]|nr:exodeoxyribonuclease VII small subunit [Oscillospiraceae bacterium]